MMISSQVARRPQPDVGFGLAWLCAIAGAALLRDTEEADFARFLGDVPPVLAVTAAGFAGAAALCTLDRAGWMHIDRRNKGVARSVVAAVGFGAAILVADATLGFAEDINIPWPTSVLFYPVIGFVAEVVFHLVPVAVAVSAVRMRRSRSERVTILVPIGLAALVETVFQVIGTDTSAGGPLLSAYLPLHIAVFGGVALTLLRRHGFVAMMLLRLTYYVIWHVIWGRLRLDILF